MRLSDRLAVALIGISVVSPSVSHCVESELMNVDSRLCVVDSKTVLGQTPLMRLLVSNQGAQDVVVLWSLESSDAGLSTVERGSRSETPGESLNLRVVRSGQSVLVVERVGGSPGVPTGVYSWEAGVCISTNNNSMAQPIVMRLSEETCEDLGGRWMSFRGDFELTDPLGNDRVYFDRYLRDWYWTGDSEILKARFEEAEPIRKSMASELHELMNSSYSELKSQRWFDSEMNNRYYATKLARSCPIEDIDKKVQLLSSLFLKPGQDRYRSIPKQEITRLDHIRHLLDASDSLWLLYVTTLVGVSAGTENEGQMIDELEEIAEDAPDCVARWMASALLQHRWQESQ